MDKAVLQYSLAGVAIIAMVIINVFGVESVAVNTMLSSVITAAVWGGVQRKQGYERGLNDTPETSNGKTQ